MSDADVVNFALSRWEIEVTQTWQEIKEPFCVFFFFLFAKEINNKENEPEIKKIKKMRTTWMEKKFVFVAKRWREQSLDKEKQMKTSRRWAKEKQSWAVGAQRERFSDESWTCGVQREELLFGACRWHHIKVTAWKKQARLHSCWFLWLETKKQREGWLFLLSTVHMKSINPSTCPADTLIFNLNQMDAS